MLLSLRNKKCAVCGKESTLSELASVSDFGASPDLDRRPAEPMRSKLGWLVQECPHCGYVAKSLDCTTGVTKSWLKSREYKKCSGIKFSSNRAAKFYKHYLISKADGYTENAGDAALRAAWACDDEDDKTNAVLCRNLAIAEIESLIKLKPISLNIITLKIDLLRRAGRFEEALETIDEICHWNSIFIPRDYSMQILMFEKDRAENRDDKCYTVSDALK